MSVLRMQNLSGWIGPSSFDSARSSQDRLTPMYSLESIKSGGAASGLASSSLDSRLGSGMLPGQAAYAQTHQVRLRTGSETHCLSTSQLAQALMALLLHYGCRM